MRIRTLMAVATTALVFAAGCGTDTDGQAKPAGDAPPVTGSSDGGGSESTLPHSGAPKVQHPLDTATLTKAQQNPCSTLTNSQVNKLRLNPQGKLRQAEAGPLCRWSNVDAGSSVGVYFPTKVIFEGLSQIYEKNKREGNADFFYQMAPVQGFPVVASGAGDLRQQGDCPVQVGLTDRQVVFVEVFLSRAKRGQLEPCETARRVAGMVLTTMKGGA
ncbi:MAG: DUF3558 domain-containing protein [Sciscionella sp.]